MKEFYGRNRDPINIFSCNSFEEFACDKYNLDRFARDVYKRQSIKFIFEKLTVRG